MTRKGTWMQTFTGQKFYPADPRAEEISIIDIAAGLATEPRFHQSLRLELHMSVAEHSVRLARYFEEVLHASAETQFWVLLHDGSEAYVKDLNPATKDVVRRPYSPMEKHIQRMIWLKFVGTEPDAITAKVIKEQDRRIAQNEKEVVCEVQVPWDDEDKFPALGWDGANPVGWDKARAYNEFLRHFEVLYGRVAEQRRRAYE